MKEWEEEDGTGEVEGRDIREGREWKDEDTGHSTDNVIPQRFSQFVLVWWRGRT